jgi:hypothetical protein
VSNAVVSIFSCTVLDADLAPFKATAGYKVALEVGRKGALVAGAAGGYWNQDTAYQCYSGAHAWLAALGGVWGVLFCLGFPVAMAAALWRERKRLDDLEVRAPGGPAAGLGGAGRQRSLGATSGPPRRPRRPPIPIHPASFQPPSSSTALNPTPPPPARWT